MNKQVTVSTEITTGKRSAPHKTDLHVGARVRLRRKAIGMSQQSLAAILNLTFQQIQKYERGSNRISASKLFDAATALGVPISYFFDGLPSTMDGGQQEGAEPASAFLNTDDGISLARVFPKISSVKARRQLVQMAEAIAEAEAAAAAGDVGSANDAATELPTKRPYNRRANP